MISEERFWSLIDVVNHDFDHFRDQLNTMDKNELKEFVWMFKDKAEEICEDDYLDYILEDIESITEDALEDLSGWVVGKGKEYYFNILNNPTDMPSQISDETPGINIQYEASQVYYKRFKEHLPAS